MSKIKELKEKKSQLYGQISAMRGEFEGKEMPAEKRAEWDRLFAEYDAVSEQIKSEERYLELERQHSLEEAAAQSRSRTKVEKGDVLRRMLMGQLTENEIKEMRASITGVSGANVVPKEVHDRIEEALKGEADILNEVTVLTTANGNEIGMPTSNDTSNRASVVADYNDVDKTAPSIGTTKIAAFNYRTKIIPISWAVLQDSAVDLEAFVAGLLAKQFASGYQYDIACNASDETIKIRGLVQAANAVNGASASAISYADILAMYTGVNSAYRKNAKWMMNSELLKNIMLLTDPAGHYIFQPSLAAGIPDTILGKKIVFNDDMDLIGAGKKPLVFGDLKKYNLRLVQGTSIITLKERYAEFAVTAFMGYQRADGVLLDAGTHPIAALTLPAQGSGSGSGSGD